MRRSSLRQRLGSDAARLGRLNLDQSNATRNSDISNDNSRCDTPLTDHSIVSSPLDSQHRLTADGYQAKPAMNGFSHSRSSSISSGTPNQAKQPQLLLRNGQLAAHGPTMDETTPIEKSHPSTPVVPTWSNMPQKPQLAILCASRFVDFFQMAAFQTYMVHQLKSFDTSLSDSAISHQAGVLQGSFTAAQIITSILWGRLADRPTVGRKLVLMIGLVGTGISMLGVGFSTSYSQAVTWRVLGGAINGTVGSARTMVAETVDKRWHPRAFLLLPAAFNFANVAGPILGGLLVDPVRRFPSLFGSGSTFGGVAGVAWMQKYPYAAANLLSTVLLFIEAVFVQLYLKETLRGYRGGAFSDWRELLASIMESFGGLRRQGLRAVAETKTLKRGLLSAREGASVELDRVALNGSLEADEKAGHKKPPPVLPFMRIWTSNVLWTLLSVAIFDFHMGAFNNLWILFLSTSREYIPSDPGMTSGKRSTEVTPRTTHPFKFSGGLAFPPPTIGFAMAILGFIGIALQFLLYPWANGRFGLMRCFRYSLFLFPLAYILAPYIALLPSGSESPEPASGFWVWAGIAIVLTLQVAARTFALPASIILVNNSSPHPSVLATIHGLGQADSATFRTIGPILAGAWYGTWLERGVVGMAWWLVASVSAIGCFASFYVRNGSGHEIFLEGEEDEAVSVGSRSGS